MSLANTGVPARSRGALLLLAYLAFVSLGLPDALLGVAWPSLRDEFGLGQALLGLPLAIAAIAYFCSGLLAGRLMQRVGIGRLLAASTALVAASVLGYSVAPVFGLVLLAAPLAGFGSGAIDATLNTYAASHFRARHMSWLHAAYAGGAMAGPAIMTAVLARGATWRAGYAIVGVLLAALVPPFFASRGRWDGERRRSEGVVLDAPGNVGPASLVPEEEPPALAALRSGRVWLQIGIFFLYTGLEVAAGQWCYTVLTEARGVGTTAAGAWAAAYWGGLLGGRLVLGLAVERMGQVRLLRLATASAVLAATLFALPLPIAGAALPFLSFSLASIYPGLMSETPRRVGAGLAPHAVGFQVSAATAGFAAVPSFAGLLGEWLGLGAIGWVIAACALTLLFLHERLVALADRPVVPP
jgi:fucose permease